QSRRHILDTVKELRNAGTSVIYTSHYVEEVEELCDRVAIMDHGHIIAAGTITELLNEAGEYQEMLITLGAQAKPDVDPIRAIPGVHDAFVGDGTVRVLTSAAELVLPAVFTALVQANYAVTEIKIKKPSLETLFLKLTGKALRDN
ncbi:MAG TPA: export ABC transporter ATP-binding protein, partial [Bacillota bacterium]|nr:export ABC transporter ATP-binding protein [Bacillota bacterium]